MQNPAITLVAALVIVGAIFAFVLNRDDASAPTVESVLDAATQPAPTPEPTVRPPSPVSTARTRWGLKLLRGPFAFTSLTVRPGANPEVDPWSFSLADATLTCAPQKRDIVWEFAECRGTRAADRLHVLIPDDRTLDIDATINGEVIRERLLRVEEREEPVSSANVTLLWHHEKTTSTAINTGVWAADGVVFAPSSSGAVDLLDAATGARLGTANISVAGGRAGAGIQEVTARGGFLYIATTTKGVVIFDVHDPASPRLAGQFLVDAGGNNRESFTNVHTLTLGPDGGTLYAINQSHPATDLRVIDVSNPAAPREVGRYVRPEISNVLDGFHDITVIDRQGKRTGFLHSLRSGLLIVDLTEARDVRLLGSIIWEGALSHSGAAFELGGKLYYAHNDEGFDQGMTVLDATDLANPTILSRFQTRRGTSIHNIEIVNGIAYVSYYLDGLRVIDLRNPSKPREIGHYDTVPADAEEAILQGAWGVKVLDGRVFISDMQGGIFAFGVTVPN